MITRIRIQNFRSFVDAEVKLRPFSLVVGANGSGKTNLLRFLSLLSNAPSFDIEAFMEEAENGQSPVFETAQQWIKHINSPTKPTGFDVFMNDGHSDFGVHAEEILEGQFQLTWRFPWKPGTLIPRFALEANCISEAEAIVADAQIKENGSGTAQVLESLKNGDREDLFDKIEENFKRYVPEVEKLSLRTTAEGTKQIQVRERGLSKPLPATELSEGTRLVLCILTIVHQENPPPIILLEDIDRGLHPRLFEYVAPMMKDIAEKHGINILATTHNPYLVDCFQDDKEAVIIVEKKDGASTLSTLADRLEGLDYDSVDPDDMPLGNLWFSGLVGGVPAKINRRPPAK